MVFNIFETCKKNTIFMCPPSHFDVKHYFLNEHMKMEQPVDFEKAQRSDFFPIKII